jgi:hypothetical protein
MIESCVATRYKSTWRAMRLQNLKSAKRCSLFSGAKTTCVLGPPHYRGFTGTLKHTALGATLLDE